jgi:hypothetical protein
VWTGLLLFEFAQGQICVFAIVQTLLFPHLHKQVPMEEKWFGE